MHLLCAPPVCVCVCVFVLCVCDRTRCVHGIVSACQERICVMFVTSTLLFIYNTLYTHTHKPHPIPSHPPTNNHHIHITIHKIKSHPPIPTNNHHNTHLDTLVNSTTIVPHSEGPLNHRLPFPSHHRWGCMRSSSRGTGWGGPCHTLSEVGCVGWRG